MHSYCNRGPVGAYEIPTRHRRTDGEYYIKLCELNKTSDMDLRVNPSRLSTRTELRMGIWNYGPEIRPNAVCLEILGKLEFAYSVKAFEGYHYFDTVDDMVIVQENVYDSLVLDHHGRFIVNGNLVNTTLIPGQDVSFAYSVSNLPRNRSHTQDQQVIDSYINPNCKLIIVGREYDIRAFIVNTHKVEEDVELIYVQPNKSSRFGTRVFGDVDHRGWSTWDTAYQGSWLRRLAVTPRRGYTNLHNVGCLLLDMIRHDLKEPGHPLSKVIPAFAESMTGLGGDEAMLALWEMQVIRTNRFFRLIRDIYDQMWEYLTSGMIDDSFPMMDPVLGVPFSAQWWHLYESLEAHYESLAYASNAEFYPFCTPLFGHSTHIDLDTPPHGFKNLLLFFPAEDHDYGCTCDAHRPCGIDPGDGDITDAAADTRVGWGSDSDG